MNFNKKILILIKDQNAAPKELNWGINVY